MSNKPNRQYSDALIHGSPTSDAPRSQPHTSQPAANPRNTCPQEPRMSAQIDRVSQNYQQHRMSAQPRILAAVAGGQQHLVATRGIPPRYAPPQNRQSKQMPMRTNENWTMI